MKDMNVHLSTMANVMASTNEREKDTHEREKKLVQQSEQVLEELLSLNLEGVTPKQVFEVAEDLASKPHKLMIFSKCPDALKSVMNFGMFKTFVVVSEQYFGMIKIVMIKMKKTTKKVVAVAKKSPVGATKKALATTTKKPPVAAKKKAPAANPKKPPVATTKKAQAVT
uniref:Uncharacterized protein n=1 Tax=Chenopodium quinoa TaxID=63459 RepID=A0A803N3T6_CHEQI